MIVQVKGKNVRIDDEWITKTSKSLGITKDETIQMYLEDNGYLENAEQAELDARASAVKIQHGASAETADRKQKKPRTVKISDEKGALYADLLQFLTEKYENVEVLTENKLISVKINDKSFKIDLIQQRPPKNPG